MQEMNLSLPISKTGESHVVFNWGVSLSRSSDIFPTKPQSTPLHILSLGSLLAKNKSSTVVWITENWSPRVTPSFILSGQQAKVVTTSGDKVPMLFLSMWVLFVEYFHDTADEKCRQHCYPFSKTQSKKLLDVSVWFRRKWIRKGVSFGDVEIMLLISLLKGVSFHICHGR